MCWGKTELVGAVNQLMTDPNINPFHERKPCQTLPGRPGTRIRIAQKPRIKLNMISKKKKKRSQWNDS